MNTSRFEGYSDAAPQEQPRRIGLAGTMSSQPSRSEESRHLTCGRTLFNDFQQPMGICSFERLVETRRHPTATGEACAFPPAWSCSDALLVPTPGARREQ